MRVIFLLSILSLTLYGCGQKEPVKPNPITAPQQFVDEQRADLLGPCLSDCQRYCQAIGGAEYCSVSCKCQSDCQKRFSN